MPYTDPAVRRAHYRLKYANDPDAHARYRKYQNDWRRNRWATDPAWRTARTQEYADRMRVVRELAQTIKLTCGCVDCGYNEHAEALDFDHVNGDKVCDVSKCTSEMQLLAEIAKCEVVCANCHRVRTAARR